MWPYNPFKEISDKQLINVLEAKGRKAVIKFLVNEKGYKTPGAVKRLNEAIEGVINENV